MVDQMGKPAVEWNRSDNLANALRRLASGDDPIRAWPARAMKLLEKLGDDGPPAQEPEPD